MKKLILLIILLFLLATQVFAATTYDANIIAHYRLDDNTLSTVVIDEKGTNGTLAGTDPNTSAHHAVGRIGGALTFNGTSDYINTNQTFQATFRNSFSINKWCKPDDGQPATTQFLFGSSNSPLGIIYLRINSLGKLQGGLTVNNTITAHDGTATFTDGQNDWKMITLVATNINGLTGNIATYINGVLRKQGTTGNIVFADFVMPFSLAIGGDNIESEIIPSFAGLLDNVMIFNKALTAGEIQQIYSQGVTRRWL